MPRHRELDERCEGASRCDEHRRAAHHPDENRSEVFFPCSANESRSAAGALTSIGARRLQRVRLRDQPAPTTIAGPFLARVAWHSDHCYDAQCTA